VTEQQWVATPSSGHLAGRASKNTRPEILLRKALHAAGARFRLERRLAPACTPDIVLPGRRLAVFVDGCFWHGCPEHGNSRWSGPNAALWESKLRRTAERDQRATETARSLGWTVVRLWEHEVVANPSAAARRVLGTSSSTSATQPADP
jgi:DNA mismatch endonuclease (patch repair protein)